MPHSGAPSARFELLTDAERANLFACETVIESGWQTFVQVGLSFAQIRDERLYKEEYNTFEAYCRAKWEYGRNYVDRLISAAQVFTHLMTNSHQKPERETQVRPLVGLSPADAQQAWERAVAVAGGRNVTERLVKQIVRQMKPQQTGTAAARTIRPSRAEQRKQIDTAIGELLVLAGRTPIADLLTAKIEELHRQIQNSLG